MKHICSVLLLCLSSYLSAHPVIIETSLWPGFTNADGSGAYFALARLVLPAADYPLVIRHNHLGRAWLAVQRGQADLSFGLTEADIRAFALESSSLPYDADTLLAVFQPTRLHPTDLTKPRLSSLHLGWEKSYNYGAVLEISNQGYEVNSPAHAIQLLVAGRIDVYLAERGDLATPELQQQLQKSGLQQQWLATVPVYAGFSPSDKGRQLKQLWDQRIQQLEKSGELQRFYQSYPVLQPPPPSSPQPR